MKKFNLTKSNETRRAGVIGWPIAHSRSPLIHSHWLRVLEIDGSYEKIAAASDEFEEKIAELVKLGYAGVNVTLPYKQAALTLADTSDEAARQIGAANTLVFEKSGKITASNTDAFGFMENLRAFQSDWQGARALVLGAGGAARAVLYGLRDAGVREILLVNRTLQRAEDLCAQFSSPSCKISAHDWQEGSHLLSGVDLLVNTTSLGMIGQPPLEVSLKVLSSDTLVTDLVYVPLETDLLRSAKARSCRVLDGLGMLLHQARPGFKAWFGVSPEVTADLRDMIANDIEGSL